ncbi:GlxA family transcriptional regulator [Methylobrevis albus]|uniref:GlxA family transcriptional regulator n=1 Tax=Methylobrevis albus TaxID=2793297 RepID=A0A931MZ78_9HYPH|nr:GlxA family transcriptional regulator [Methylobrevis albus]MBH0237744.1 GlxA family transcriptional regulator [Methylobrevis albus]
MSTTPLTVGFLLVDDFALMSYAAAVEPLRAANRIAGAELYRWRHVAVGAGDVRASNGLAIVPDGHVPVPGAGQPADGGFDLVLVCAGGNPAGFDHPPTYAWLRGLARAGVRLGGVSGGPWLLARAGLLGGRRCTIHWEHMPAFVEEFPDLAVTGSVFEIDGDRVTAAGGVAVFDLMLELIADAHGRALAAAVGDWFLRQELRGGGRPQRLAPADRFGVGDPKLLRVLAHMETRIEEPPRREDLAALAGVSLRRLEALFRDRLGTSIARHGLGLRLERARTLVVQSRLSLTEIAAACGFASAAHFSRSYRARFGRPPRADRGA